MLESRHVFNHVGAGFENRSPGRRASSIEHRSFQIAEFQRATSLSHLFGESLKTRTSESTKTKGKDKLLTIHKQNGAKFLITKLYFSAESHFSLRQLGDGISKKGKKFRSCSHKAKSFGNIFSVCRVAIVLLLARHKVGEG